MPRIRIGNRVLEAEEGANLGKLLAQHGFLHLPCGGRGLCGQCLVRVRGAASPLTGVERLRGLRPPLRLACQVRVLGDLEVEILRKPRAYASRAAVDVYIEKPSPLFKIVSRIPAESRALVLDYAKCGSGSLVEIHGLGLAGLVEESCDSYRVALVDVGTTRISYLVVDERGNTVNEGHRLNPQLVYGADIATRISRALEDEDSRRSMIESLRREIEAIIDGEPCTVLGLVAGNSAMTSFLLGLPLGTLARRPFRPYVKALAYLQSSKCRPILVLPPIAGFVGGDALADLALAEYLQVPIPYMILDIGTNTEIVVVKSSSPLEVYVASAPAGPAFEGHVSSGVSAPLGGLTRIRIAGVREDGTPLFEYEGGGGLAGSAIVSLVAELLRHGFVDPSGRFVRGYRRVGGVKSFVIGVDRETGMEIRFSQLDMREVQKAIAAIRAGWRTVLREAGLEVGDVEMLIVAGAFGAELDLDDATYIGLLPAVDRSRVALVGNAVLAGLKTIALDRDHAERILGAVSRARHIELATRLDFAKLWIESLRLGSVQLDR